MKCFAVEMRDNVTHNASIFHDLIPKLKAPLRGSRFHTREDIGNAMRREVTRLDNEQWSSLWYWSSSSSLSTNSLGDYFEGW
ncbi:hypothetical protein C0J52_12565 [Blattella germanica]|nr:hypothetical protein C0J52_12565 [Blattella germanica]